MMDSFFKSQKKYTIISLFSLLMILLIQSGAHCEENFVFAPFISRLKAVESNSRINITWKDSRDIDGTYLIYRHTEEINRNNFTDAFLVDEIPSGVEYYSDSAVNNTDFYYAVIAKNKEGNIFDIFLPYRNITLNPVAIKSIEKIGENAASVRYLTAAAAKDSIFLDFNADTPERYLAVLRNVEPIFGREDVLSSTLLNIIPSYRKSYTDYPIPGVPYYYCVIDAELLKNLSGELIPFENTTLSAAEIPLTPGQEMQSNLSALRAEPLPGFKINNYLETGSRIKTADLEYNISFQKISDSTKIKIDLLISGYNINTEELIPVTLEMPEKTVKNTKTGEEIRLSVIIEKYFLKNNWQESVMNLLDLSRTTERKSLKNRISFYLGQSYYFLDRPEYAFFEFLKSSESFYPESRVWMDKILLSY